MRGGAQLRERAVFFFWEDRVSSGRVVVWCGEGLERRTMCGAEMVASWPIDLRYGRIGSGSESPLSDLLSEGDVLG